MNHPCSATLAERQYDGGTYGKPHPTQAQHDLAESRAVARLLTVQIGNAACPARQLVAEALTENDGLLKLIANTVHGRETNPLITDEAELGRAVMKAVREYAVRVAERRGLL